MNKFLIIFYASLGIFFTADSVCLAQNTAVGSASVSIVSPITVSQTDNMVFGNIPVPVSSTGSNGGTVASSVSGVISQASGGGSLSQSTGSKATASFNVSGQASSAYNVTVPSTTVTLSNGSDTMTANTFTTSESASGTPSLSNKGADVVKVSASLNLNTNQQAGLYTAANPFTVTINYN